MYNFLEIKKSSEAFISPVDVYFIDKLSAVQPDLIYVSNENKAIMGDDGYFYGAPDLIVEVLSSDKKRDTVTKKDLYEKAGVKEYFIANPTDRNVQCFILRNGKFILDYEAQGLFKSTLLQLQFTF